MPCFPSALLAPLLRAHWFTGRFAGPSRTAWRRRDHPQMCPATCLEDWNTFSTACCCLHQCCLRQNELFHSRNILADPCIGFRGLRSAPVHRTSGYTRQTVRQGYCIYPQVPLFFLTAFGLLRSERRFELAPHSDYAIWHKGRLTPLGLTRSSNPQSV
jgi:hypothetical protein